MSAEHIIPVSGEFLNYLPLSSANASLDNLKIDCSQPSKPHPFNAGVSNFRNVSRMEEMRQLIQHDYVTAANVRKVPPVASAQSVFQRNQTPPNINLFNFHPRNRFPTQNRTNADASNAMQMFMGAENGTKKSPTMQGASTNLNSKLLVAPAPSALSDLTPRNVTRPSDALLNHLPQTCPPMNMQNCSSGNLENSQNFLERKIRMHHSNFPSYNPRSYIDPLRRQQMVAAAQNAQNRTSNPVKIPDNSLPARALATQNLMPGRQNKSFDVSSRIVDQRFASAPRRSQLGVPEAPPFLPPRFNNRISVIRAPPPMPKLIHKDEMVTRTASTIAPTSSQNAISVGLNQSSRDVRDVRIINSRQNSMQIVPTTQKEIPCASNEMEPLDLSISSHRKRHAPDDDNDDDEDDDVLCLDDVKDAKITSKKQDVPSPSPKGDTKFSNIDEMIRNALASTDIRNLIKPAMFDKQLLEKQDSLIALGKNYAAKKQSFEYQSTHPVQKSSSSDGAEPISETVKTQMQDSSPKSFSDLHQFGWPRYKRSKLKLQQRSETSCRTSEEQHTRRPFSIIKFKTDKVVKKHHGETTHSVYLLGQNGEFVKASSQCEANSDSGEILNLSKTNEVEKIDDEGQKMASNDCSLEDSNDVSEEKRKKKEVREKTGDALMLDSDNVLIDNAIERGKNSIEAPETLTFSEELLQGHVLSSNQSELANKESSEKICSEQSKHEVSSCQSKKENGSPIPENFGHIQKPVEPNNSDQFIEKRRKKKKKKKKIARVGFASSKAECMAMKTKIKSASKLKSTFSEFASVKESGNAFSMQIAKARRKLEQDLFGSDWSVVKFLGRPNVETDDPLDQDVDQSSSSVASSSFSSLEVIEGVSKRLSKSSRAKRTKKLRSVDDEMVKLMATPSLVKAQGKLLEFYNRKKSLRSHRRQLSSGRANNFRGRSGGRKGVSSLKSNVVDFCQKRKQVTGDVDGVSQSLPSLPEDLPVTSAQSSSRAEQNVSKASSDSDRLCADVESPPSDLPLPSTSVHTSRWKSTTPAFDFETDGMRIKISLEFKSQRHNSSSNHSSQNDCQSALSAFEAASASVTECAEELSDYFDSGPLTIVEDFEEGSVKGANSNYDGVVVKTEPTAVQMPPEMLGMKLNRKSGETWMLKAAQENSQVVFEYAMKTFGKWCLDETNYAGDTPLLLAVKGRHLDMAAQLLEAGANVNAFNRHTGLTALHLAAGLNELEIVKMLLSKGADLCQRSFAGINVSQMHNLSSEVSLFIQAAIFDRFRACKMSENSSAKNYNPFVMNEADMVNLSMGSDDAAVRELIVFSDSPLI